jgi:hypothetical protein
MHIITPRGIDLDAYLAYLATVRELIPPHVWAFASNPEHHQLDGSMTLHDSWLESIEIVEIGSGPRSATRDVHVSIRLLGPMHDLWHVLRYEGVRTYVCEGRDVGRGHGDVYAHEVRLANDGQTLIHELRFGSYAQAPKLLVECRDFVHAMQPL